MASASVKRSLSEISNNNNNNNGENTTTTSPPAKKSRKTRAHRLVYTPGEQLFRVFQPGKRLKVYIRRKYFDFDESAPNLWGTDVYMVDSDLLAAALHCGKVKKQDLFKNSVRGVIVGVEIVNGPQRFSGSTNNDITSKECCSANNGFVVDSVKIIDENDGSKNNNNREKNNDKKLNKQKLFLPNVTVVFNLSNEPSLKYTLNAVADRGHESADFTCNRFKNEVLFVETDFNRYELSFIKQTKRFRWARVRSPQSLDKEVLSKMRVPLLDDHVEVLHDSLLWKEIEWGPQSVIVGGNEYMVTRIQFHKHHNPESKTLASNSNTTGAAERSSTPLSSNDHYREPGTVDVKDEPMNE